MAGLLSTTTRRQERNEHDMEMPVPTFYPRSTLYVDEIYLFGWDVFFFVYCSRCRMLAAGARIGSQKVICSAHGDVFWRDSHGYFRSSLYAVFCGL